MSPEYAFNTLDLAIGIGVFLTFWLSKIIGGIIHKQGGFAGFVFAIGWTLIGIGILIVAVREIRFYRKQHKKISKENKIWCVIFVFDTVSAFTIAFFLWRETVLHYQLY